MLLFFYRAQAAARSKRRDESLLQGAAAYSPYSFGDSAVHSQMASPAYNFLSPTMARVKNGVKVNADLHDPDAVEADAAYGNVSLRSSLFCLLPACCDLGGTTVSGIGLLFVTASVFQMLRGSIIFFTAIFSVIFLNRKLYAFHWVGMSLTMAGVTVIGLSSILGADNARRGRSFSAPAPSDGVQFFDGIGALQSPSSIIPTSPGPSSDTPSGASTGKQLLGVILVVSQLMSATQMVVEEKFLKSKKVAEFVVGCEGSFGVAMMLAIALPVVSRVEGS